MMMTLTATETLHIIYLLREKRRINMLSASKASVFAVKAFTCEIQFKDLEWPLQLWSFFQAPKCKNEMCFESDIVFQLNN